MTGKIIVFAPHPGDEIWGCGGTIAKKINEGHDILIVIITDGRLALLESLGIDSNPSPEELKEMRKEDSVRATGVLGVQKENLIFLDFVDGTLKENEMEAQKEILRILSENSPLEVYYTYEKDAHPDHRTTNNIVVNSIKELELYAMKYQYSILHKYARIGPIVDRLLNVFKHNMVIVQVSNYLSLKEAAIRELRSETTIISNRQERPLGDPEPFLKNTEIFYIEKNINQREFMTLVK